MKRKRVWVFAAVAAVGCFSLPRGLRADASAFSSCEAAVTKDPEDADAWLCYYETGRANGVEDEAVSRLADLTFSHPANGWPHFYLGLAHWSDAQVSQSDFARAARLFEAAGDLRGSLLARMNRHDLLFRLGWAEEAAAEAAAVRNLGERSDVIELLAKGRLTWARHLLLTSSDLEAAYTTLRDLEGKLDGEEYGSLRRKWLANLARVAQRIGRLREARVTYRRLLEDAAAEGDLFYEVGAWYGLTQVASEEYKENSEPRRRDVVLELAGRTLEEATRAGRPDIEAKAHWVLGVLGMGVEGRRHLEQCSALAFSALDRSYCLSAFARDVAATDPELAQARVQQALQLASEVDDPWSQAFAWSERMRVSWAAVGVEEAIADSWGALQTIETLRDLQDGGSDVQAGLFSTWADDYHWFAGRLLEEARASGRDDLLAEAFAVSERLRARALTDWLRAAGKESAVQGAVPVVGSQASGFAALIDIQRALGPREALLAFHVAPWVDLAGDFGGGSWVISVTRRRVRAYPLPDRRDLRQAVDLYTGLFEQRDGSEAAPSAHLYRQLLAPALADLPAEIDRLVLVPDDALHRLPFAALRRSAEAEPLATTHRISLVPSASLWLGWRRQAPEAALAEGRGGLRASALVLAAPAPWSAGPDLDGQPASFAAGLPPLVHARREGRAVADALGRGTELARGAAASEALLARADLSRFGILHLAVHAVTDEAHPERSAVVLAPGPVGETGEDGLLQSGEIAVLDLRGKLVVLSSCRSASGTVLRGEGVMSLGRAFFQAGARTVVASLWPVRDDEAAALFESFYRHLARGETVAAALQAAQADRIAAGAPASAWAAFVALGDGDLAPVPAPARPRPELRLALTLAGAALLALVGLAARAGKRRLAAVLASRRPQDQRAAELPAAPSTR